MTGIREGTTSGLSAPIGDRRSDAPAEDRAGGDERAGVSCTSSSCRDAASGSPSPRKGFGAENMSALRMLVPADGVPGIIDFVVETVDRAGANACPPIIVGVGIGGTFEASALLAKKAALRPI